MIDLERGRGSRVILDADSAFIDVRVRLGPWDRPLEAKQTAHKPPKSRHVQARDKRKTPKCRLASSLGQQAESSPKTLKFNPVNPLALPRHQWHVVDKAEKPRHVERFEPSSRCQIEGKSNYGSEGKRKSNYGAAGMAIVGRCGCPGPWRCGLWAWRRGSLAHN